jgi:hypothetical protein
MSDALVSDSGHFEELFGILKGQGYQHFVEEQVAHSHALHSKDCAGGIYLVGPVARYSLNFDRLSPLAQEAARSAA